ncbi:MAG: tetratricopeptide repeat protein [Pseudomonas sp.]
MRRVTAVLLMAGALTGCASHPSESPWLVQRELSAPKSCEPLTGDQELVLGVSQEMALAGRRHAALANLERLPENLPQVRLSKARLLRLLGHGNEAETLYAALLNTCLVADAHHGLGQLAASRGNNARAQEHLRAAASLSPANDAIRNDLGVVYLNQRELAKARFELLTAMELNENANRAAINMLTLLVYQGNWQAARDLVHTKGLSADEFGKAEQRAKVMRAADMGGEGIAPIVAGDGASGAVAAVSAPIKNPPAGTHTVGGPTRRDAGREASQYQQAQDQPANPGRPAAAVAASRPSYNAERLGSTQATDERAKAPASTSARVALPVALAAQAWAMEETTSPSSATNQIRTAQQEPSADVRPIVCRLSRSSMPPRSLMECLQNEG